MFRKTHIYIKLRRNHVEITHLDNGQSLARQAEQPFSSVRNVVGSFTPALLAIKSVMDVLDISIGFGGRLNVLIHQLEGTEGGLSDIEKRALRDIGEMIGGTNVFIAEDARPLSTNEALAYF